MARTTTKSPRHRDLDPWRATLHDESDWTHYFDGYHSVPTTRSVDLP